MNKYGVENFIVEELEYVKDENILSEREVYWIKELETYGSKGYNATKGGDGTQLSRDNRTVQYGIYLQKSCGESGMIL